MLKYMLLSKELQKKFADAQGLEFPLIADTETTLLQELGCWGEKVACGRRTIGILRTTYLVNEDGIIEKIFTPKEIKTKIHAEQILEYIHKYDILADKELFAHLDNLILSVLVEEDDIVNVRTVGDELVLFE